MIQYRQAHLAPAILLPLILFVSNTIVSAQTVKIQGLIKARSGATMILTTPDSAKLIVLLTDNTQVGQIQGVFKARRKDMSMAALIPGLAVQVEATYNDEQQLVAKIVKFKGNDLAHAKSIQAGLHETQVQVQQNKAALAEHEAALQAQEQALRQQKEELETQQKELSSQQKKIAANKVAIDAAIARFGQLDDYYILDEATIYFGNGKVSIDPKDKPRLVEFAEKAKKVEGYMVQILGYASSTGSIELNQKLSEDRAHSVANFLVQQCNIRLTNLMAPGAMGESRQVGNDRTAEGQAQNRRVVARVLQNKGIAGLAGMTDADRQSPTHRR
jgi:outer membrane protein OmpA-like peptidoglycan-associated protein